MPRPKNPQKKLPLTITLRPQDRAIIETAAARAGMTIGPYLVSCAPAEAARERRNREAAPAVPGTP
ncbi:MAG: hypothetical protein HZA02_10985 [Nitrospinae bacterium]|nr:hypothetical protein [Nitrospinota bacterium]